MIKNFLELVEIEDIEYTDEYDNMVDISVDIDQTFSLSNGIVSHNSAKSFCISGFAETGRDYWGVYPLKGKPINVRGEKVSKIKENNEIKDVVSAIGLEFGKKYTSTKELRYGKLVLISDADCVDENTLILSKRGYVEIKNLNYDDEILTHSGEYKRILNIIETNKEKYIEIISGKEVFKFGENHEIPVFRNGKINLIKAKDIQKTDKLLKKNI